MSATLRQLVDHVSISGDPFIVLHPTSANELHLLTHHQLGKHALRGNVLVLPPTLQKT
eukprot:CAMPEP_0175169562 /NCGR_PEP_ID=MMETSP0087-20121206/29670_1 /TAXON_ID=136419 /ORGANISM="Unknown Unknown, Strain D1" /LENGTH=57 /DNA_ID=CAMNT_0016459983 /DNA_START=6 /DNA_END=175 /DNA_ORIENTATION=+